MHVYQEIKFSTIIHYSEHKTIKTQQCRKMKRKKAIIIDMVPIKYHKNGMPLLYMHPYNVMYFHDDIKL